MATLSKGRVRSSTAAAGCLLLACLGVPGSAQHEGALAGAGRSAFELLHHLRTMENQKADIDIWKDVSSCPGRVIDGTGANWGHCEGSMNAKYCILPKPEAYKLCSMHPDCAGVAQTKNSKWLRKYHGRVQLVRKPFAPNGDWRVCKQADAPDPGGIHKLITDCRALPRDLLDECQRSGCTTCANMTENAEITMLSAMAMAGGQLGKNTSTDEHPLAGVIQDRMHSKSVRYCNHFEACEEVHDKIYEYRGKCFAEGICGMWEGALSSEVCLPAMDRVVRAMGETELDSICVHEPGTDMFCPEMNEILMTTQFECWSEMHRPAKGCSPECTQVWKNFRRRFPQCSALFAEQIARSQSMMRRAFRVADKHGLTDRLFTRSHREICADIDHAQSGELSTFHV